MRQVVNPFRRFCKAKGIKGKGKKKFRRELARRASAKAALADERTSGGLIYEGR